MVRAPVRRAVKEADLQGPRAVGLSVCMNLLRSQDTDADPKTKSISATVLGTL